MATLETGTFVTYHIPNLLTMAPHVLCAWGYQAYWGNGTENGVYYIVENHMENEIKTELLGM